jgi:hypothetical protein
LAIPNSLVIVARLLLIEIDRLVIMVRDARPYLGWSFSQLGLLVGIESFLGAG